MTARLTEEYLAEVARQLMQGSRLSVETGSDLLAEVRALTAERDELQQTFDLMWDADQRAIKRWQAAGEDRDLIWPDRTKLTEWLLTEHDALQRQHSVAEVHSIALRLREALKGVMDNLDGPLVSLTYWEGEARAALADAQFPRLWSRGDTSCVGEYEAPRDQSIPLKVRGVGRMADEPRSMTVFLTDQPTDDEMRDFHDFIRSWQRFGQ